ncbi:hypothetical protein AB5I41_01390 [Sphingomonas sp. MMS24-JH45]
MDNAEHWLTAVKLVGGAIAALVIGLAGVFTGRKTTHPSTSATSTDGDVVAATFAERGLMERLTAALLAVNSTLMSITTR